MRVTSFDVTCCLHLNSLLSSHYIYDVLVHGTITVAFDVAE
jgi:hypothetical protein